MAANRRLRVTIVFLLFGMAVWVGSAHHKPTHPIPPGHRKPPVTTTTVPPVTTTTVPPPTTTTVPPTTTTTVPPGTNLIIEADTVFTAPIILEPGSTITFTNGAELLCGAGCHAEWDGITATGEGNVRFIAGSAASTIRNSVFDLQPVFEPGHHPLHWHLVGDGSRGTLVENVTIQNSTNKAFVPHGSHGITFRNVVATNILGEAFWWNKPFTNDEWVSNDLPSVDDSNDILIDNATADVYWTRDHDLSIWHRITAFMLGRGTGNTIINSLATGVVGGQDCSGFQWPEKGHGVWTFTNNRVENLSCHGIFVWQNNSTSNLIDGFTGGGISHGAYKSRYHYQNVDVPYTVVHALGWSMSDSHAGNVTTVKHSIPGEPVTFTNVTFDSFTVNNGTDSGPNPGIYILNQTNLACADVIYQNVVSGTQVIIDGGVC